MRDLRPIALEEGPGFLAQILRTFYGQAGSAEEIEARLRLLELDRALGVFEDGELVATAGTHSMRLTVPGGLAVPAAGIYGVTVLPTHRRQGLLTALVRRQLDDARSRGEPVAILHASEGAIYGRFGYGVASYLANLKVERSRSAFARPLAASGLRYVSPAEALEVIPGLAERLAAGQPGMITRSAAWWRMQLEEGQADRQAPKQVVLHEGSELLIQGREQLR